MNDAPVVSVVIPVYNAEKYLRECLDSVTGQTLKNIEIICVDDGSTDSSLSILREYEKRDSRLSVLTQKNQFAGVARNNGLNHAKGEYVAFLDSDDFFDADMLRSMYNRAKAYEADLCVCKFKHLWQNENRIENVPESCKASMLPKYKEVFSRKDIGHEIFQFTIGAPWNKLYRREFVLEHHLQFQDTRTANDEAFVKTALALAERITSLDQYLVVYRKDVSTSLQSTKKREPLLFLEAYRCLKNNLMEHGVYHEVQISFSKNALDACLLNLNGLSDPDGHKKLYQCLRDKAFYELDIVSLKEEQVDRQQDYAEYQKISTLSWEEYIFQKSVAWKADLDFYRQELQKTHDVYRRELQCMYEELQKVYISKSFRTGHMITWLPRKLRGGIRCLRENGMGYTLRRIKEKFAGLSGVKQ